MHWILSVIQCNWILTLSMIRLVIILLCVVGVWNFRIKKGDPCGVEASSNLIHHNPWVVYLEYWRDNFKTDIRCTATLIDDQHLITAAHCMTPKFTRLVARLGEYDLTKEVDCLNGICSEPALLLNVVDVIINPKYDGKAHDIAVLKLAEKVPYSDFIRPVCLPTGVLESKATLVASGWGEIPRRGVYSSIKKIIPLPIWEREACVKAYKHFRVPAHVICAGGVEGVDTCRGDSGGPLVWIRERIEIWGVTSAGNVKCGTKNSPGLYTNVADHLEWILNVVEVFKTRDLAYD